MYAALLLLALESLREKKDRGAQRRADHFHVCVSRFSPTGANFVEGICYGPFSFRQVDFKARQQQRTQAARGG